MWAVLFIFLRLVRNDCDIWTGLVINNDLDSRFGAEMGWIPPPPIQVYTHTLMYHQGGSGNPHTQWLNTISVQCQYFNKLFIARYNISILRWLLLLVSTCKQDIVNSLWSQWYLIHYEPLSHAIFLFPCRVSPSQVNHFPSGFVDIPNYFSSVRNGHSSNWPKSVP